MPSPVITGCRLRQRLYHTRLYHRLGRTRNKNRRLEIVVNRKEQSEGTGGTHRRTSSGVISRPRKKKREEPYRQFSREARGRGRGGGYTACGLESTHEQVARRDLLVEDSAGEKRAKVESTTCATKHAGTVKEDTLNSLLILLLFLLPFISCSTKGESLERTFPYKMKKARSLFCLLKIQIFADLS